jgi:uncharacterized protein YndB with AHSA1/START domain
MSDDGPTRQVEARIEVASTPEALWRAVSVAEELVRWFPPEARVTPGVGGTVRIAWDGNWQSESRIQIWEPPRRLRTVASQRPFDASGQPLPDTQPLAIAVDYEIEGEGERARLRLVHSGFGRGAEWDDEIEGVRRGWGFELPGLKHYLERHSGRDRHAAWLFRTSGLPETEAWRRLREGYLGRLDARAMRVGTRFSVRTSDGDDLAGRVLVAEPWGFLGTLDAWDDGLFRASVDSMGGQCLVHVGLQAWSGPAQRVADFRVRAAAALAALFPR